MFHEDGQLPRDGSAGLLSFKRLAAAGDDQCAR
jgi:hypothetical protein